MRESGDNECEETFKEGPGKGHVKHYVGNRAMNIEVQGGGTPNAD